MKVYYQVVVKRRWLSEIFGYFDNVNDAAAFAETYMRKNKIEVDEEADSLQNITDCFIRFKIINPADPEESEVTENEN